jgi:outer membrane immunogenic protein
MMKTLTLIAAFVALSGTPILAADMAVKAPPPQAVPSFDWSGFYFGMSAGYAFGGNSTSTFSGDPNIGETLITGRAGVTGTFVPAALSLRSEGALIAGAEAGYNYRVGIGVVGIEADLSALSSKSNSSVVLVPLTGGTFPDPFQTTLEKHIDWVGTVRGRLGVLASDRLLLYGTGGFAFGGTNTNLSVGGSSTTFNTGSSHLVCFASTPPCLVGNSSRTSVGWVAGGGFEYAVTDKITFKSEYLFIDLGHATVTATGTQTGTTPDVFIAARVNYDEQIVRAGLNVHLN